MKGVFAPQGFSAVTDLPIDFGDQADGAGNIGKRRQMVLDQGPREVGDLLPRMASALAFEVLRRQQRQLRKDVGRDHEVGIILGQAAGSGKRKGTAAVNMGMGMDRFDDAGEVVVEKADVRQAPPRQKGSQDRQAGCRGETPSRGLPPSAAGSRPAPPRRSAPGIDRDVLSSPGGSDGSGRGARSVPASSPFRANAGDRAW